MYYFFDDIVAIKNLDLNNIKINTKSYQIFIIHDITYLPTNSLETSYFIISNTKEYIGKSNGNKYLRLVHKDERRNTLENQR